MYNNYSRNAITTGCFFLSLPGDIWQFILLTFTDAESYWALNQTCTTLAKYMSPLNEDLWKSLTFSHYPGEEVPRGRRNW